jgi:hypothetical protein
MTRPSVSYLDQLATPMRAVAETMMVGNIGSHAQIADKSAAIATNRAVFGRVAGGPRDLGL